MINTLINTLKPLASLRLTVVLFALAMFLIFAGTLAQVHDGIWMIVHRYFRSYVVWIDVQLFIPENVARVPLRFPYPGGFIIGGLMLINLLAAHTVRFKLTEKRAGILVIHAGVILLLIGELVTALYAHEGSMTIDEGSYSQYTEDTREVELAFIDPTHPDHDRVIVVPHSMLDAPGTVVHDPLLPFDITVDRWMPNSVLYGPQTAPPELKSHATAGLGEGVVAKEIPRVTGVEEQTVDAPTAYITLSRDGRELGTWLVSLYIDTPQPVTGPDNKPYGMALRFKREYKPYTLHLIDFRHDKFVGTETPRNFSSLVRLVDPTRGEDRQVLIYMNHPLRYAGETFYQSAYKPGDTGTILQVVRNPGWLLPYISCYLISIGAVSHFTAALVRFLKRARP